MSLNDFELLLLFISTDIFCVSILERLVFILSLTMSTCSIHLVGMKGFDLLLMSVYQSTISDSNLTVNNIYYKVNTCRAWGKHLGGCV